MGSTVFSIPLSDSPLSNMHPHYARVSQLGDITMLNTVDSLSSVSNYYIFWYQGIEQDLYDGYEHNVYKLCTST